MTWPIELLGVLAVLMALATAYLIRVFVDAQRKAQVWVALFLLGMMGEMWVGAVVYLWAPSQGSLVAGLAVSGVLMAGSVALVFLAIARAGAQEREGLAGVGAARALVGSGYAALVAGLVLVGEILMGWTLLMAAGTPVATLAAGGAIPLVVQVIDSPWFLFTMAGEMLFTVLFLRARLPGPVLAVLVSQAVIMGFSPPALGSAAWTSISIYVSSGAMIGLFVYLME